MRETPGERRRRLTEFALGVVLATGLLAAGVASADIYVGFGNPMLEVAPGDTFSVYLQITQAGAQFNAFDASIRYDPLMLTSDPITPVADQRGPVMTSACSNTFHKFDVAADSLRITLSLLCSNTYVTGPGTIYRVRFRAGLTAGVTALTLGPFTEFYRAGLFVRPVQAEGMVVRIGTPTAVDPQPGAGGGLEFGPPSPNPRRGAAAVILDFTLPRSDTVGFDMLDTQGRRVAGREVQRFERGRHRLTWSPPVLPNGDYFIRLRASSSGSLVRKWTVLR